MSVENSSDTQHVDGSAPLPDVIETTDELARFVEWFVSKKGGYKVWKTPPSENWARPFELPDGRLVVNEGAVMWRWHFDLMGRLFERWPDRFRAIEAVQTMKQGPRVGLMVMLRPLAMVDVLRFFEDLGFIVKGARA